MKNAEELIKGYEVGLENSKNIREKLPTLEYKDIINIADYITVLAFDRMKIEAENNKDYIYDTSYISVAPLASSMAISYQLVNEIDKLKLQVSNLARLIADS